MRAFLRIGRRINRNGRDPSAWPHGDFDALMACLRALAR